MTRSFLFKIRYITKSFHDDFVSLSEENNEKMVFHNGHCFSPHKITKRFMTWVYLFNTMYYSLYQSGQSWNRFCVILTQRSVCMFLCIFIKFYKDIYLWCVLWVLLYILLRKHITPSADRDPTLVRGVPHFQLSSVIRHKISLLLTQLCQSREDRRGVTE